MNLHVLSFSVSYQVHDWIFIPHIGKKKNKLQQERILSAAVHYSSCCHSVFGLSYGCSSLANSRLRADISVVRYQISDVKTEKQTRKNEIGGRSIEISGNSDFFVFFCFVSPPIRSAREGRRSERHQEREIVEGMARPLECAFLAAACAASSAAHP